MARPIKKGIDYYSLDVNFLSNLKVRKIIKACGASGVAVIVFLLGNIYEDEGYYMRWNSDVCFLIADNLGIKEVYVEETVRKCLQVDLFDQKLFDKYKILTSKGIQKRFLEVTKKRRNLHLVSEFLLVNSSETLVSAEKTPVMGEKTQVSDAKVHKVKESKGIDIYTPPLYDYINIGGGGGVSPEIDEKFKKVIELYQYTGFDKVTPSTSDTLKCFSKSYPYAWLEEAFKIAGDGGKLNLNYIRAILERWRTNGKTSGKRQEKTTGFHNFEGHTKDLSREEMEAMVKAKREKVLKEIEAGYEQV
ncbi:DUF4373 domain-containing protein [Peptoniphilus sp. GNH]|nr:DUF4373 domain-containing protein [Peptoniphilus sp. GNH]